MEYRKYLKLHGSALSILGLWPPPNSQDPRFFSLFTYKIYSLTFLGVFCFLFNLSEFIGLFYLYEELRAFASDLSWFLVHLVTSFKILVFLWKIEDVRSICSRFPTRDFSNLIAPEVEDKIFKSASRKSARFLAVYYIFSVAVLFNAFIAPIYRDEGKLGSSLNSSRQLPYYAYVHCDYQYSPCYEIAYVYQIVSTCIFSFVIIHCDNLYIVLVTLTCSELEILQRSLETVTQRAEEAVRTKKSKSTYRVADLRFGWEPDAQERLLIDRESLRLGTNCVKHHHQILEASKKLEDVYNLLILAQFLSHLVQICFQMYLVTEIPALSFDGLSVIAFVIAMVIEVYVFCRCANDVETESKKVSEAAYNADWTSSSESLKRTLLLVMVRAERPVQFSVGKFGNLSLGTLVSVLKASFSYFMVLRGIQ